MATDFTALRGSLELLLRTITYNREMAKADLRIGHRPPFDLRQRAARRRSDIALGLVIDAAELVLRTRTIEGDEGLELLEMACTTARTIESEDRAVREATDG